MPRLPVALRGLRPDAGRGDGVRHARGRASGSGRAGGRRRRGHPHGGPRGGCSPRLARAIGAARGRPRAREGVHLGGDGPPHGGRLPPFHMRVSAVVISHGHARDLERSLPALAPQVDELLVIANVAGSVPPTLPDGVRVHANDVPQSFAANANLGADLTGYELVLIANPDAIPAPGAVAALRDFMAARPRCGVTGPRMLYGDGSWQPSRRGFPTVGATVVRRTPLRLLFPPLRWQKRHYLLDERPDEPT